MGRIDSNQNSFNNNTNQPNPPQPPQDSHYPHQQPTNYVTPDTIDIVPPHDSTDENNPEIQQHQLNNQTPQPNPTHPTHEVRSQPVTYPPAQTAPRSPMHPTHEAVFEPVNYPPTHQMAAVQHSPMHPTHGILSQPVMYPPAQTAVPFPPPSPQMGRANTFPPQPTSQPPLSVATGGPVDMPANNAYTIVTPIDNGWRTGLLDCMVDPENAIQTALFPFVTFGQIAEIVDEGATSCGTSGLLFMVIAPTGMPWLLTCTYRAKLRKRYGIPVSPAADWAVHLICGLCGLCQEYRELQARGMDPSVGWAGNMGNSQSGQRQQAAMTPPTNQTMMA